MFFIVKQKRFFWCVRAKEQGFSAERALHCLWNEALPWQVSLGLCDGSAGACGMKQQEAGAPLDGKTVAAGSGRLFRDTNAVVVPAF